MYPPPPGPNNNPQGYSQINNPYPNIDNNYQNQYPPMNPGGYNDPNMFMNPAQNASNMRGIINTGNQANKYNEGEHYNSDSSLDTGARKGFIRKVYVLVLIQLLVTVIIGYFAYNSPSFKKTFASTIPVILISVALMALSIVIACCTDFFRRFALPIYIIFTILMSLMVAIAISAYQSSVVLTSVVITLVIVVGLTIYAWVTDTDFTGMGTYLMVFCMILCCFGIALFFWKNSVAQLVYACLGALLFSIYIIYDTQLILGKGKYSYSLDDAYLAAIELYLDIINLFLNLLQIVGRVS